MLSTTVLDLLLANIVTRLAIKKPNQAGISWRARASTQRMLLVCRSPYNPAYDRCITQGAPITLPGL